MPNSQLRTNRYAALLSDSSGQDFQDAAGAHPSAADCRSDSDRGKCDALEKGRSRKRKRCQAQEVDASTAATTGHEPEQQVTTRKGKVKRRAKSKDCEHDASVDTGAASAADTPEVDRPKMVGGVRVQVLRRGTPGANVATPGSEVRCLYQGRLPAKEDKVFDAGEVDFVIGDGQVVRGLDLGIRGMCVGERRLLHVPSKLGYGKKGRKSKVPPHSDLVFDITLTHAEVDFGSKLNSITFMEATRRKKKSREAASRRRKKPRQP